MQGWEEISQFKPCPFCGSTNIGTDYVVTYSCDSSYETFGCLDCGANFNTDDGSITEWNNRYPQDEVMKQLQADRDALLEAAKIVLKDYASSLRMVDVDLSDSIRVFLRNAVKLAEQHKKGGEK